MDWYDLFNLRGIESNGISETLENHVNVQSAAFEPGAINVSVETFSVIKGE